MSEQTEIRFEIRAQGAVLAEYMRCRSRVTCIMGPLGSGKTYGSCMRVFNHICEQKPNRNGIRKSRWIAVRNTYSDLESTTMKDWKDLYHSDDMPALGRFVHDSPPTHYMDFDLEDGTRVVAEVVFLALDKPQHVKKLRGLQATGFWLNEMKELPKAIVDMCDLRHGRYPSKADGGASWHGMIGDTNAPDDDHWYYKLAEETKPQGWTFLRQPGGVVRKILANGKYVWVANSKAENLGNLPGGSDYYVNGMAGKADDWIRVNLANEYGAVVSGKPIYEGSWDESKHLSKFNLLPVPRVKKLLLGFDFGRTPACIIGQLMPSGKLRVIKELVATGMGIRKFMDEVVLPELRDNFGAWDISTQMEAYCDPAGIAKSGNDENSPIGILWDEYNMRAWPTSTNQPLRRWEAVTYFLLGDTDGIPAFELSPECKVLRKGFNGGYALRRLNTSGERYADTADKNAYSHPHDALQYLALGAQGEADYAWRASQNDSYNTGHTGPADTTTGY